MVARQGIVFLLLGLIAVILGVAILIMGLIMRHEGVIASRMCYLGLLAVITGIWGVLEARVTQLLPVTFHGHRLCCLPASVCCLY